MEGSQQTQSQGASKQAMIYICGGKNSSLHSDNEAHAKQLKGQTIYNRSLHGSETNHKIYLRP